MENSFFGVYTDTGRVKDKDFFVRELFAHFGDTYNLTMVLSQMQSIILKNINLKGKEGIAEILWNHGIKLLEEVNPLARLAMACPALPLRGLAQTEAERRMPSYIERISALTTRMNLDDEEIMIRMTGCPYGCASPLWQR
jgi:sulfite reductase (ferredoxin)